MKESITSRVGRIISGSLNQLIDAFENAAPQTVLEEAIREIDSTADDVRTELGIVIANKHLATKQLLEVNQRIEDLTGKIELALKEKRDDLAEAAISQQMDLEAQAPVIETTLEECGKQELEYDRYIAALQAKKRQMQDELNEYLKSKNIAMGSESSEHQTATTPNSASSKKNFEDKMEKAQSAFDRVLHKQSGVGSVKTDVSTASQLAELEKLERQNRIKERLAKAKANFTD